MSNDRVVPNSQPTDRPTIKIFSEGNQVSGEFKLLSAVVSRAFNKVATAHLVFFDGDPATEDFKSSAADAFIPGKEIEVHAGYHSEEEIIFKGIVVKHQIKARKNKSGLLRIVCKDKAAKLTIGRKSKYFYELTDSEVIEELINEAGLSPEVEATDISHKELVQFRSNDWDFIVSRAEANGLLVLTQDGTLIVKKPELDQEPALELTYGGNLMDFEGELDATYQFGEIQAFAWDTSNQEMLELAAESLSTSLGGNISSDDLASILSPEILELKHGGQLSDEELQAWANAQILKSRLAHTRGIARFQGFAGIQPGMLVNLNGLGDRFNGKAYVSAVRHEINSKNWETTVELGLSPNWFHQEHTDISDTPANGLLPAVNGLQIGLITQLEEDPEGEARILVRIPMIDAAEEGIWTRIARPDAGENRGIFFLPEIGDEVVLGFLNDDPRNPIILGVLNSSDKPAPVEPTDDNHEKGIYTRSEMKVVFDDDKKSINIETPNGNIILISDDEGGISLTDENGNTFTMNSDGIALESAKDIQIKASGDVNIEGTNVNISAQASLTAEGSAGAEVSSSATTVIKGSLVQIN